MTTPALRQSVFEFLLRSQSSNLYLAGEYLLKADDPIQVADFMDFTYGDRVWNSLNSQRRFYNLIGKTEYGPSIGWRIRYIRNPQSRPLGEIEAIGDVGSQTYARVHSMPRQIITPLGSSELAQWAARKEGGIGDALGRELEFGEDDHIKEVQQESLLAAVDVVKTAGATGVAAVSNPTSHRVNDQVYTNSNTAGIIITAVNNSTGVISFTTLAGGAAVDLVANEAMTTKSRRGITSLDDIIEADGRTLPGANPQNVDVYNIAHNGRDPASTTEKWASSTILDNAGVMRGFDYELIDDAIQESRDNGGEPDLILLDNIQHKKFKQQLQVQRRYMEMGDFTVKRGEEQNVPGIKAGIGGVSVYDGIAVFPDVDVPRSVTQAAGTATLHGGNVYVLDTRWIEYGVAFQTEYFQEDNPIVVGKLMIFGLFRTTMELKCHDFRKQVKVTDLSA